MRALTGLAPSDPQGRHKGLAPGRWSRPSAPQCVAGNLADWPKQVETTDVRAEWARGVGGTRTVVVRVLGVHVGHVVATGGEVKLGS